MRHDFALTEQNAGVVAEICRRLDGLPLAIELAAARIKLLPASDLLARLERRLPLLTHGPRDAPARQHTLRDTIAWSYNLLSERERQVFETLGVFVGGFDIDAAEAVVDTADRADTMGVVELIGLLEEKSLLRTEEVEGRLRIYLLETIREFALERLAEAGRESQARGRHAAYYVSLAEAIRPRIEGPEGPVALARLETEHANMRAALAWAVERGDAETALRLVAALWKFWWVHRHLRDGRAQAERALDLVRDGFADLRVQAHYAAGSLAMGMHDLAAARKHGNAALALKPLVADRFWAGPPHFLLGNVARLQEDLADARAQYTAALSISEELPPSYPLAQHLAAMALASLGAVACAEGELDEALAFSNEALAIWLERGDPWGQGIAVFNLAEIAARRGEYALAAKHYRESISLNLEAGDRAGIGDAMAGLAFVAAHMHTPKRAARLLGASEAIKAMAGSSVATLIPADRKEIIDTAQRALGAEAFATERAAGAALGLDEALSECAKPLVASAGDESDSGIGLSARELEILNLIADGHTNREIADRMSVSLRTVTTHTANAYNKLGVSSRTAAVAAARRRGLL